MERQDELTELLRDLEAALEEIVSIETKIVELENRLQAEDNTGC